MARERIKHPANLHRAGGGYANVCQMTAAVCGRDSESRLRDVPSPLLHVSHFLLDLLEIISPLIGRIIPPLTRDWLILN